MLLRSISLVQFNQFFAFLFRFLNWFDGISEKSKDISSDCEIFVLFDEANKIDDFDCVFSPLIGFILIDDTVDFSI